MSWLALRGKCANCQAPISARYPLVELATGLLSGFVAWRFGFGMLALAALAFTWLLIALTMIDFDTQFLPDSLTYPLLWLGLLVSLWHPAWGAGATPVGPREAIIGAVAGYLSLWSVYWLFKLITGKEGMGYGDFKLFAALGAWLGWGMLLPIIVFASGVGAMFGIVVMIRQRKGRDTQLAFGPFLAIAGWLALVAGHDIVTRYLSFFGPASNDMARFRIGLTGGIACGKSTVANLFAALGVTLVDTDLLAREVVEPGSPLLGEIAAHFGAKCCRRTAASIAPPCASGCSRIRRKDSGWSSSHIPAIRELTDARCEAATGPYVMVAIPLLVETPGAKRFDRVLVVDCEPELQLARLQARDGTTREQAATHARRAGHARAATRRGRRRDPEQRRHRELARPGGKAASAVLVFDAIGRSRHMSADEQRRGLRSVYGGRRGRAE